MHILFILEHYYPEIGGVETLFHSLVNSSAEAGHRCTVLTSRPNNDQPVLEQKENITIHRINVLNRYAFTFSALSKVLRLAKDCDLIHTTSYNAALPAWIGAKIEKKKIIITFHEVWGQLWFRLPFLSLVSKCVHFVFEQLILALDFDRYVAPSKSTALRLKASGIEAGRISQIYPGIEYERKQESGRVRERGSSSFLYFGRLGISKGLDLLLPAFAQLHEQYPEVKLKLITPSKPKKIYKWIKRYIRKHKIQDVVELKLSLPFEELQQEIKNADCVVIPSYSEGFCYTAVETMALGTPIVSSGQGALDEVIGGKFVQMKEQLVEGLVQAMEKAFTRNWGIKSSNEFLLKTSVNQHLKLYEIIVNE